MDMRSPSSPLLAGAAGLWIALVAVLSADAAAEPTGLRDCADLTPRGTPVCPELVVVPAGQALMGSPADEPGHRPDEAPLHAIVIARAFAVGKTEVTFSQWDACMADGGCQGHRPADFGWGRGERPVIGVSWQDAQSYVQWLGRKTGRRYRLLSEAEWEYAARAGTTTPFDSGAEISARQANLLDPHSREQFAYRRSTVPVGSFPANAFGLQDVHGNVWEWVEDCYSPSYDGTPADGSAWTAGSCRYRVLRGGSWYQVMTAARAANRNWADPAYRSNDIGFRVARSLD